MLVDEPRTERRTVMIREVDLDTWAYLRGEAARRRWTTAAVLEHIVAEWRRCKAAQAAEAAR